MSKTKSAFSCTECGAVSPQWNGQCSDCEAWNTIIEVIGCSSSKEKDNANPRFRGYASIDDRRVVPLSEVPFENQNRIDSGLSELDRVLGGGIGFGLCGFDGW